MSSLSIAPDLVAAASGNLEDLGSALRSANAAAASRTTAIAAPAADEVSAAITALFGAHAQEFQALSAEAAAFHEGFVNLLSGGAAQYVSTEVANVRQTLVNTVNAPAQALLGHPLIGTGQGTAGVAAFNLNLGFLSASLSDVMVFPYGPDGLQASLTGSVGVNLGPISGGLSFQDIVAADSYGVLASKFLTTPLGNLGISSDVGTGGFFPIFVTMVDLFGHVYSISF